MTIKLDPELVKEFLQEAHELLESLSRQLFVIEEAAKENGPWLNPLPEVFRALHTLKGMSSMFGYADVSEVAHSLEDLVEKLQSTRPDPRTDLIDLLFDGVELIEKRLRMDVITTQHDATAASEN
jgi:two-component system chemotaxis sensor kinase CheA